MRGYFARAGAAALVSALLSASAAAADRVALLIGNAAYTHTGALKNPTNDVATLAARLETLGFAVETRTDLDRAALAGAIRDFRGRARQADTALLFFSGHGMEIAGENYLAPVDARLERDEDAEIEAVALSYALAAAAGARRLSVVIVDACRTNAFPTARRSGARGFRPLRARRGQLVAFSTAPGAVALDGSGDLSPFSQALTETLSRETAATLDVRRLFGGLGPRVSALAGGAQEPFMHASGFGPEVVTLTGRAGPTSHASETDATAPGSAEAAAAYGAARALKDPAALDLVATRFPDTIWADLARLEADKLRAAAAAAPEAETEVETGGETDAAEAERVALAEALQRELRRLGLYAGAIDGAFGPQSRAALAAYEKASGRAFGEDPVTEATLAALKSAPTPAPPAEPEPEAAADPEPADPEPADDAPRGPRRLDLARAEPFPAATARCTVETPSLAGSRARCSAEAQLVAREGWAFVEDSLGARSREDAGVEETRCALTIAAREKFTNAPTVVKVSVVGITNARRARLANQGNASCSVTGRWAPVR